MLGVPIFLSLLRTVLCMGLCCRTLSIPGPGAQKGPAPAQSLVWVGTRLPPARRTNRITVQPFSLRLVASTTTAYRKRVLVAPSWLLVSPFSEHDLPTLTGVQSVYLKKIYTYIHTHKYSVSVYIWIIHTITVYVP